MENIEKMEAGEPIEWERGLTFEKMWAYLKESERERKEAERERKERELERDRERKERELEREREWKEWEQKMELERRQREYEWKEAEKRFEKTERAIDKLGKQMGGLHRGFGDLAEHLVGPGIVKRFNAIGFHFKDISEVNYRIPDETGRILTEIDILLEDEETVIAVEVKTRPVVKDIKHNARRMEILRRDNDKLCRYIGEERDNRKILGAIAGAVFPPKIKKAVIDAGFFVVEQTGETMRIDMPPGFKPKEW